MPAEFPAEVKQLIDQLIESLAQLEVLLLLRNDPGQTWNAEDVAKRLYITEKMASSLLADLQRSGLAEADSAERTCYHFVAPNENVDRLIEQLAGLYQERRTAVISLIYSKPIDKVQTFADAFRLRKETPP